MLHKRLLTLRANARYLVQHRLESSFTAQCAMIGDAEAVSFIADTLEQVEALRVAWQYYWFRGTGDKDLLTRCKFAV